MKRLLHPTSARGAFYISGTLFFLSLTLLVGVHIGRGTARADSPDKIAGFVKEGRYYVITESGDIYDIEWTNLYEGKKAVFRGNVWGSKGESKQ